MKECRLGLTELEVLASKLTSEQLKEVEVKVFEQVPMLKGELTGVGFCASKRRERNSERNILRKKLMRELIEQS